MSSQLPRQRDGELAEYDGSLTGDQVFYTNIYIFWHFVKVSTMKKSGNFSIYLLLFQRGYFQRCKQCGRQLWGLSVSTTQVMGWVLSTWTNCMTSKVSQCEWCSMKNIVEVIISKRRWWLRWTHSLPQSSSPPHSHLPRRRGSLGAGRG